MTAEQGAGTKGDDQDGGRRRKAARPGSPRITVNVTKDIIARSEARDSGHCMIAEAIKEAVPNAQNISVDLQTCRYSDPVRRVRLVYLTPRAAQVALVMFDLGKHGDPFTMVLRNAQVVKMGDPKALRPKSRTPAMPEGTESELRRPVGGSQNEVPVVVGGKTPPTAALSNTVYRGKRRAFGLRLLKY